MSYKFFISSENSDYRALAHEALISVNEMPLLNLQAEQGLEVSRQAIQQADVFLLIVEAQYGSIPVGRHQSYPELEYEIAHHAGKLCLIFAPQNVKNTLDARQKVFLETLMQAHIFNFFQDKTDLAAQIKLAVSNYRQNMPFMRLSELDALIEANPNAEISRLLRASQNFQESQVDNFIPELIPSPVPTPPSATDLPALVNRALELAQDDLEQIVRRALELHDAQAKRQQQASLAALDGRIEVQPIWGEPQRHSQFHSDIFMVMPFREEFTEIYNMVIRPTVANLNLVIKRGDDFRSTGNFIVQEVWAALNACRLVIAEMSLDNPNVYYELGIAHTLGKPVILLTQQKDIQTIPFDVRHLRFIVYENDIAGAKQLEEALRNALIWTLNDLDEQNTKL